MVASEGFTAPLDAVASPDGSTFYFTAFTLDEEPLAAVFAVASAGGGVSQLHAGAPLSFPTGLVMSCDGSTLVVSDRGISSGSDDDDIDGDAGAIYSLDVASGQLATLAANGIVGPSGLALSDDCQTLYVTGATVDGLPALFRLPLAGGAVATVYAGEPLLSPTGMYVDPAEVAWVLDHVASADGGGVLFAIAPDGSISTVMEELALGTPGGCSLNAAGTTAFMPTRGSQGQAQLTTIQLADGETGSIETPGVVDPAGLRTARDAAIFALVDHEGNAIYLAK